MAIIIGGGTGNAISINSTVGSTGQVITSDGTNSSWGTKGVTNVTLETFVTPGTWTKPATVVAIKVTVVGGGGSAAAAGGGGGGGTAIRYLQAPSIPGPVAVTAGPGTNSFGAFASATTGSGAPVGGGGGVGSSGDVNIVGGTGYPSSPNLGAGGPSTMGGGGRGGPGAGRNYGGGGGGTAGIGAPGIVIVEVFN
jgi:hypothetical protein